MAVSDVLKNFRSSGYSDKPKADAGDEKGYEGAGRILRLSEDEAKGVGAQPGEQVTLQVSGKLEQDGCFHVMSVGGAGGGMEKDMAAEVAGVPPMMRNMVAPSPG